MKKAKLFLPLLSLSLFACATNNSSLSSETTSKETDTNSVQNTSEKKDLKPTTLFMVGDSTVASFDDNYYYPRYGYGTQMANYLDSTVTVNNLALSGRSSKSYIVEANYQTLVNSIKSGDYLMIGFGHNDEKNDDELRFTNPTGDKEDTTSFKYYLYEYYIKLAQDKGATPILCTPIVRASTSNSYTGSDGHITSDGDYASCIRSLGEELGVTVIDLTTLTKNLYTEIGFDEAIYYHAWTTSSSASVDKTHLNIYGAKNTAYMICNALKETSNNLKNYVLDDIVAPTKEKDLVVNPNYKESTYTAFDPNTYQANPHFANFISEGWYGTAFGDTGGSPVSDSNGFVAEETQEGIFKVGQEGTASPKGKITSSSDGLAMIFKQVSVTKNFELSAKIKVLTQAGVKQAGFGLMLRDDIYVNQATQNAAIVSNYLASGIYNNSDTTSSVLFRRENAKLANEGNAINSIYAVDDEATAKITRLGQAVTLEFTYKDQTYTKTYYDFDLMAIDQDYMYVGMFATRGTTIECSEVTFNITSDAQGA